MVLVNLSATHWHRPIWRDMLVLKPQIVGKVSELRALKREFHGQSSRFRVYPWTKRLCPQSGSQSELRAICQFLLRETWSIHPKQQVDIRRMAVDHRNLHTDVTVLWMEVLSILAALLPLGRMHELIEQFAYHSINSWKPLSSL